VALVQVQLRGVRPAVMGHRHRQPLRAGADHDRGHRQRHRAPRSG
jgi:hypothetical protein